jgi:hypothetical protein
VTPEPRFENYHYQELFKIVKNIQTIGSTDKEPLKKLFQETIAIIVPTFGFVQTCKAYSLLAIRKAIAKRTQKTLCSLLPQGILFFLLPTKTQNAIFEALNPQWFDDLNNECLEPEISHNFYQNFDQMGDELNGIVYYKENGHIKSNRVIEYFINQLKDLLKSKNLNFNWNNISISGLSFFYMLDLICTHGFVDLRITISSGHCSIADYIKTTFDINNQTGNFSVSSLSKIVGTYEYPKNAFEHPKEKQEIIEHFIKFYFNIS